MKFIAAAVAAVTAALLCAIIFPLVEMDTKRTSGPRQTVNQAKIKGYTHSVCSVKGKLEGDVFCVRRMSCAAFLIYVFQLNGVAAKFRIWPDIRISRGDKETLV